MSWKYFMIFDIYIYICIYTLVYIPFNRWMIGMLMLFRRSLEKVLFLVWWRKNLIFMEDSTLMHHSLQSMMYKSQNHQVKKLQWLVNLPNLNSTYNQWKFVEDFIRNENKNIWMERNWSKSLIEHGKTWVKSLWKFSLLACLSLWWP